MVNLWTPAEVAARLGIDPSRVRRLAERYNLGTKLGDRMRVYTEDDVVTMQQHSTGKAGRPRRLSETLESAADGFDRNARDAIAAGDPESADRSQRIAGHIRRLATHHASERILTDDDADDPVQVEP